MSDSNLGLSRSERIEEHVIQLLSLIDRAYVDLQQSRALQDTNSVLPQATDELNAVLVETTVAINRIMDAADVFAQISETLPPPLSAKASAAATAVYEACAFQDITGQRISKIIRLLQVVSDRIHYIVSELSQDVPPAHVPTQHNEKVAGDAALLNGPGLPGEAKSQSDIDALFSESDS